MELLMPLTVDEVLEERRKTASRKAVVVEDERAAVAMRQVVEEGVHVIKVWETLCGVRFDLVVMAYRPRQGPERAWYENEIVPRMGVGAKVEWIAERLSLA